MQFVKHNSQQIDVPQEFIEEKYNLPGLLRKFRYLGFSESQILQAISKNQRIGSFWKSSKWHLVKNRDGLTAILQGHRENDDLQVNIGALGEYFFGDYRIDIQILDIENADFKLPNIYYFDVAILNEKLALRQWSEGDKMQVLGMRGHKKLSDLFVDSKIDLLSKHKLPVMVLEDQILAVLTLRRSGLYLLDESKQAVSISWKRI
jgi:tRNA(Ile)-lysidine synthase